MTIASNQAYDTWKTTNQAYEDTQHKEDLYTFEHESRCKAFRKDMDFYYKTDVEGADIVTVFADTLTEVVYGSETLHVDDYEALMYHLGGVMKCLKINKSAEISKLIDNNIDMVISDAVTEQMMNEVSE